MKKPSGWVKLHREITEHWIWESERHSKQSAWLDLIMMANHKDKKVPIGNKVITVKKGQMWTSYEKLKARWRWSDDRLRGFIGSLVSDKMIVVQPTNAGTLITVLNYLKYQGSSGSDEEEPGSESGSESGTKPGSEPGNGPGTNKNDTRTTKNPKKGTAGTPRKYEA